MIERFRLEKRQIGEPKAIHKWKSNDIDAFKSIVQDFMDTRCRDGTYMVIYEKLKDGTEIEIIPEYLKY